MDNKSLSNEIKAFYKTEMSYKVLMNRYNHYERMEVRKIMSQNNLMFTGTPDYIIKCKYDDIIACKNNGLNLKETADKISVRPVDISRACIGYGISQFVEQPQISYEEIKQKVLDAYDNTKYTVFLKRNGWNRKSPERAIIMQVLSNENIRFIGNSTIEKLDWISYEDLKHEYMDENMSPSMIAKNHDLKPQNVNELIYFYGLPRPNDRGKEYHDAMVEYMKSLQTNTFINNYGVTNPNKNEIIKKKIRKTNIDRYGSETPFTSKDARDKATKTYMAKYGTDNPSKSPEILDKIQKSLSDSGHAKPSMYEKKIMDILDALNVKYHMHDYHITNDGHEIDIVIDDNKHNACIECSPSFTHNSNISGFQIVKTMIGSEKPCNYHMDKFLKCKQNGYNLITLDNIMFGKHYILERYLKSLLIGNERNSKMNIINTDEHDMLKFIGLNSFIGIHHDDIHAIGYDDMISCVFNVHMEKNNVVSLEFAFNDSVPDCNAIIKAIDYVRDNYANCNVLVDNRFEIIDAFEHAGLHFIDYVNPMRWFSNYKTDADWIMGNPVDIINERMNEHINDENEAIRLIETKLPHAMDNNIGYFSMFDCGHAIMKS